MAHAEQRQRGSQRNGTDCTLQSGEMTCVEYYS